MSRKLLLGTVLAGASILVLVFGLGKSKPVYARSVSAFLAQPIYDSTVRVQGTLVKGSICMVPSPCEYRFRMTDGFTPTGEAAPHGELSVRYAQCIVPDTFGDIPGYDVPLTVEGEQCASCHRFEAARIMTRSYGVYRMKPEGGPPLPPARLAVPTCAH